MEGVKPVAQFPVLSAELTLAIKIFRQSRTLNLLKDQ